MNSIGHHCQEVPFPGRASWRPGSCGWWGSRCAFWQGRALGLRRGTSRS